MSTIRRDFVKICVSFRSDPMGASLLFELIKPSISQHVSLGIVLGVLLVWLCVPVYDTGTAQSRRTRITDVCHLRLPMGWRLCVNMSQEVSLNCVKK